RRRSLPVRQTDKDIESRGSQSHFLTLPKMHRILDGLPRCEPMSAKSSNCWSLIPSQKLSEAIVIGATAKSRFHAFPRHNGFRKIMACIRVPEPCVSGRLHPHFGETHETLRIAGQHFHRSRPHAAEL